jgi:hypothetical protein
VATATTGTQQETTTTTAGGQTGDNIQLRRQDGSDSLAVTFEALREFDVVSAEGEQIGDVEDVIRQGGEVYVVVGAGGFLGLGERDVALPVSDMILSDEDTLVMPQLTEEQIQNMREVDPGNFETLGGGAGTANQ